MFDALRIRLRTEFEAIGRMLRMHDQVVSEFYSVKSPNHWAAFRSYDPGKHRWEIYNQCSAFTRLYAVYSAFVEDLIKEYLLVLPALYGTYQELPEAVVTQQRLGLGQILLRLGNEGPYNDLNEANIVMQVSRGLAGERPYSLIPHAFFVDRQNYRLDTLSRLMGYVGFKNAADGLSRHPRVKSCIEEKWPEATTLRAELKRFVDLRNLAAHSELSDTIALDELLSVSELVLCMCEAAAELLTIEVFQRQLTLKALVRVGEIVHTYHKGMVGVVKMRPCRLVVGDEVAMLSGDRVAAARRVHSIQVMSKEVQEVNAQDNQMIGLGFDGNCRTGSWIAQAVGTVPEPEQLEIPLIVARAGEQSDETEAAESDSIDPTE